MNLPIDLTYWATAGGIVLIDLVLSGDNALVIGAAASRLPRGQRLIAIIWGGVLAVVFRMLLAIVATELLFIPYLRSVGAVILLVIAIRLLIPESPDQGPRRASAHLIPAILTILAADATMSLDNVLAVGALAHGQIELLVAGLLLSMLLLFVASALIARIIERVPLLMDVAAVVLAWTAASLVVEDSPVVDFVRARMTLPSQWELYLHLIFIALVLLADLFIRLVIAPRRRATQPTQPAQTGAPDTSASGAIADTPALGEGDKVDNKTAG
ncbi:MAG TPA: YjbE family putative metal transport protein [Ktedonobacterales bacterium]|jgi:YjbE family integral membrane protein